MKRIISPLSILLCSFIFAGIASCSNEKSTDNHVDSTHDTITVQDGNDSLRFRFKQLAASMPVPFDMLKKFSGAHLPFHGELLNIPENASGYNSADLQALNLGIYGADLAYMISQDKLGDAAPFLKSIRRLSDAVVVPTAFDATILKRYDSNHEQKDSLQKLIRTSYKRIDSTLQGNDRLTLATLILAGGWLESIYLTTEHIGEEQQNEKNKVLFDMLAIQQPYLENITALLGSFPADSLCVQLHSDFEGLKKVFPQGADIPPAQFSASLKALRNSIVEIRKRIISIQ